MTVKASINKLNDAMDAMRRQDARLIQTLATTANRIIGFLLLAVVLSRK